MVNRPIEKKVAASMPCVDAHLTSKFQFSPGLALCSMPAKLVANWLREWDKLIDFEEKRSCLKLQVIQDPENPLLTPRLFLLQDFYFMISLLSSPLSFSQKSFVFKTLSYFLITHSFISHFEIPSELVGQIESTHLPHSQLMLQLQKIYYFAHLKKTFSAYFQIPNSLWRRTKHYEETQMMWMLGRNITTTMGPCLGDRSVRHCGNIHHYSK